MATKEMDWTYPIGAGDSGIFEIGRRLAEALGRAPDATRFTYDPRAMLRTTRDIERASTGGQLFVGFQVAAKFDVEAERYRALLAAGTQVVAWAAGSHASVLPSDVSRPSFAERLRGMAADRLGPVIGLPMVVAGQA